MKKLILATCVAALGLPAYAQQTAPAPPVPDPALNPGLNTTGPQTTVTTTATRATVPATPAPVSQSTVDYSYYGGPSTPKSLAPNQTHREDLGGMYGPYKLWGVPDELTMAEQARDRIRMAAVEFGRFRRQFTGSTQFWMDEHRTELAKSRFAMDEAMWRTLHPPEYFGDGGYLYNTAESVGSEVIWGPPRKIMVENPRPLVNVNPTETLPAAPVTQPAAPVSRTHSVPASPRVIAGGKKVYDAAASVGAHN